MAKRRAKGSGSISWNAQRKKWVARAPGRARIGYFATREAAEEALSDWVRQLRSGIDPSDAAKPLKLYLETWLTYKRDKVRPSTLEFYQRHCEYIVAYLGNVPLDRLTTPEIERMLTRVGRDGLSPRSVNHVRSVLSNALTSAIRWQLLRSNPAEYAESIPVETSPARALRPSQIRALLDVVEGHRIEALFHVALLLGLRMGEILGLRWSDIDFEQRQLTIAQQITGGDRRVSSPKTASGRRVLPLPPVLLTMLQQHYVNQQEEQRMIKDWQQRDLVFASERGTPFIPANMRRLFKQILAKAGLPHEIRFHDLRHTAITTLAGVTDQRTVQAIAGHARAETTANIYTHARSDALRIALETVENERKQK